MRMRITAPAVVDGEPRSIKDVVDVTEPGEIARLIHYGQAVQDEPATETTADPGGWKQEADPASGEASDTTKETA